MYKAREREREKIKKSRFGSCLVGFCGDVGDKIHSVSRVYPAVS